MSGGPFPFEIFTRQVKGFQRALLKLGSNKGNRASLIRTMMIKVLDECLGRGRGDWRAFLSSIGGRGF